MPALWPEFENEQQLDKLVAKLTPFEPAARAAAHELGFAPERVTHLGGGSVPLFRVDDAVLKLFPPADASHAEAECTSLRVLKNVEGVPAPRLFATTQLDSWTCLAIEHLPGRTARAAWDALDAEQRQSLSRQLGKLAARLHAITHDSIAPDDLSALTAPGGSFEAFVESQHAQLEQRFEQQQLDPRWRTAALDLAREWWQHRKAQPDVFLHTELNREHVLFELDGSTPRITGLVDFEPAMFGARDYDLSAIGLFWSEGIGNCWTAFNEGLGSPDSPPPLDQLAMALHHRYANLGWWLERLEFSDRAGDVAALARTLFGRDAMR